MTGFTLRDYAGTSRSRFVLRQVELEHEPPGGGGGEPVDGYLPATPILLGGLLGGQLNPQVLAIRWSTPASPGNPGGELPFAVTVQEGETFELHAELSHAPHRPVQIPLVLTPAPVAAFSAAPSSDCTVPAFIAFAAGQTSAFVTCTANSITPAAGQTTRVVAVFFNTNAQAEVQATSDLPAIDVVADLSFGSFSAYVRIVDAPAATPVWTWEAVPAPPDTIELVEGFGLIQPGIGLDQPAVDDVTFDITLDGASSAAINVHIAIETPTVTIPAGETFRRARLRILDDLDLVPASRNAIIVATKTAGTASLDPGGTDEFEIDILNNDFASVLQWGSGSLVVAPGGGSVVIRGQVIGPLIEEGGVVAVTLGGSATSTDYQISWAVAPGQAHVPAGAGGVGQGSVFDIATVTAAPGASASVLTFEFGGILSPTVPVVAPTASALQVTIQEAPTGQTFASVELDTGRAVNMIQGLVACPTPADTLPEFAIDGTRCQTVGFARNGDGKWLSVYVYALIERDTFSAPGTGTPIELEESDGTEPLPAGAFDALPTITFTFRPANTGVDFTGTTLGNSDLSELPTQGNWTGPSADTMFGWEQAGGDVVRETRFQTWLKEPGPESNGQVLSGLASADKRCGVVEGCLKQVAGMEMFLVSGALHFGSLDYDYDLEDTGIDTPAASGGVFWRRFEADPPAGWEFVIIDAHPGMSIAGGTLTFLPDRGAGEDYYSFAGDEYQFQFALIKTGGNVSSTEAEAYLKRQNVVTWLGGRGVDKNAIFGDTFDYCLDLEALPVVIRSLASSAVTNKWRRAQLASPIIAGEELLGTQYGDLRGVQDAWINGDANSSIGFRQPRTGWVHGFGVEGAGAPSGNMVDGGQGIIPCAGWWRRADIMRMGVAARLRLAAADVSQQRFDTEEWLWNVAKPGTGAQAGEQVCPIVYSAAADSVLWRSPLFWTDRDTTPANMDLSLLPVYQRGPTSRPWNVSEVGDDPAIADMLLYWHGFDMMHMSRVRNPVIDGWWGAREFMARRMHQQAAAFATRALPSIMPRLDANGRPANVPKPFTIFADHHAFIAARRTGAAGKVNYVIPAGAVYAGHPDTTLAFDTLRKEAWALQLVTGCFATGQDALRDEILGANLNGVPWWSPLASNLSHVMHDSGWMFRVASNSGNPTPYSPSDYGPTVLPSGSGYATGAWPSGNTGWNQPAPPGGWPYIVSGGLAYQVWYMCRAIFCWRLCQQAGSAQQTLLDRVWNLPGVILAGARAHTQARGDAIWQYYTAFARGGPTERAVACQAFTKAELEAGAAFHQLSDGPSTSTIADNFEQLLAALVLGVRATGNVGLFATASSVYDHPAYPTELFSGGALDQVALAEAFAFLVNTSGWAGQIFHTNSNVLMFQYRGVATWLTPVIAWLQRQLAV